VQARESQTKRPAHSCGSGTVCLSLPLEVYRPETWVTGVRSVQGEGRGEGLRASPPRNVFVFGMPLASREARKLRKRTSLTGPHPNPLPKAFIDLTHVSRVTCPLLARPGSPEGCEIVAGGRRPPDHDPKLIRHLEEVQDVWHPSEVRMTMRFPPEVFALLRPPATSWQPCGSQKRLVVSLWKTISQLR
jgi:hypothetical protein